jgi:uncharacterized protein (DUF4415 family)
MKKRRPAGISAADWNAVESPPIGSQLIARMRPARRGRPPLGETSKEQVTLRIDADVIARFRASGAGWQSRINEVLRRSAAALDVKSRPATRSVAKKAKRG